MGDLALTDINLFSIQSLLFETSTSLQPVSINRDSLPIKMCSGLRK
jgi:hypothetical protein